MPIPNDTRESAFARFAPLRTRLMALNSSRRIVATMMHVQRHRPGGVRSASLLLSVTLRGLVGRYGHQSHDGVRNPCRRILIAVVD
jgi:hypothetical protein